jgi:hypothetical protein
MSLTFQMNSLAFAEMYKNAPSLPLASIGAAVSPPPITIPIGIPKPIPQAVVPRNSITTASDITPLDALLMVGGIVVVAFVFYKIDQWINEPNNDSAWKQN